jgi:alpha-1,2-mannosyltransferase
MEKVSFRPEKNHELQLKAFKIFMETHPELKKHVKLILMGACRNGEDENRLNALRNLCHSWNLADNVHFKPNISYEKMKIYLSKASIGLHTMWNEHFGIGIVEYMAAGVIPIVHNSGGPKLDIVIDYENKITGFTAMTAEEYANAIYNVFSLSSQEIYNLRKNARLSVHHRFSNGIFKENILRQFSLYPFNVLDSSNTRENVKLV